MDPALVLVLASVSGATLAYIFAPLLSAEPAAGSEASLARPLGYGALPLEQERSLGNLGNLGSRSWHELEALLRQRDAAYASLADLEADLSLEKLDHAAYLGSRTELELDAAAILQALDHWEAGADASLRLVSLATVNGDHSARGADRARGAAGELAHAGREAHASRRPTDRVPPVVRGARR